MPGSVTKKRRLTSSDKALLREVFAVLLSVKGSCIHTRNNGFVYALEDGPQPVAIEQLIKHFGPNTELADLAAGAYLDRFESDKSSPLFRDSGSLDYAQHIAERFHLSAATNERLITNMARMGWYGRLDACAKRYLGRGLKPEEVILLVDSYVNDTGTKSTAGRKDLPDLLRKYVPRDEVERQLARIAQHDKEFHDD